MTFPKTMKPVKIILSLLSLAFADTAFALRSDSLAISKTEIHLTIQNFSSKKISGYCKQSVQFKIPSNTLHLDLSSLAVDSVICNNQLLSYTRNGDKLNINLGKTYSTSDSCTLSIYYQGTPAADPGGWGGFYFQGNYAYNLGVGFTVNPHSYGRAWFPCIDEFDIKSQYDFYITTDTNFTAACNGILESVTHNGDSKTWHYHEDNVMSAYLVSVSVSPFVILKSTYQGINNNFPVWLNCAPGDSNKVKNSFVNLPFAIGAFEKAFGRQPYQKVGYNFVPFNAGAMEHAGNITYPNIYADGSKNFETLLAHELSHHWWGNAVTCIDAGDMWLNEGWASYCEHFFTEQLYGKAAYNASIADNHLFVLRFAHIRDGNVFSMVNIPHNQTYGSHVYKKGADVVHSLRGAMGDSVFFKACKAYQDTYRYKNASSQNLQAAFEQNGGGANATEFFNNWVYEKGQPHVIVRKQEITGSGPFQVKITTYQQPRFTTKLYKKLPVEIFFFRNKNVYEKRTMEINNETDVINFTLDFKPVFVCLDYEQKLSDAITEKNIIGTVKTSIDVPEMNGKITVTNILDTAFIRLEHHWVGPEKYITTQPAMSNYRYVTLDGIWNDSTQLDMELTYDGRQQGPNSSIGYLDHTLIFKTEDSLTLLYRSSPDAYWDICKDATFTVGSKVDKFGKVLVKNAKKGDYVLAMHDVNLGVFKDYKNKSEKPGSWRISPNPADSEIYLNFIYPEKNSEIEVTDESGKIIYKKTLTEITPQLILNTSEWRSGKYTIRYFSKRFSNVEKVVIVH